MVIAAEKPFFSEDKASLLRSALRKEALARRKALTQEEWNSQSLKIQKNILNSSLWEQADTVYLYAPFRKEADTELLFQEAQKAGKRTAFPRVSGKDMTFYYVDSLSELISGYQGIREPMETLPPAEEKNPLIITPGLLFNAEGYRLGYGGGFYDRYLAAHPLAVACGAYFSLQFSNDFSADPQDISLSAAATERKMIIFPHDKRK